MESTELSMDEKQRETHWNFIEKNICFFSDVSYEEQLAIAGAPYDVIARKFNFVNPKAAKATFQQQQQEKAKEKVVEPPKDSIEEPDLIEPAQGIVEEKSKLDDETVKLKIIRREKTKNELNHAKNRAAFIAGIVYGVILEAFISKKIKK